MQKQIATGNGCEMNFSTDNEDCKGDAIVCVSFYSSHIVVLDITADDGQTGMLVRPTSRYRPELLIRAMVEVVRYTKEIQDALREAEKADSARG